MANSPDFVAHALDLLAPLGPVTARSLFGGHGVYLRGLMFALLDDDELFVKVDDLSRPRFLEAGCRQWTYPGPKGPVPGGYYRPPDEAHEEPEAMRPWAELGFESAQRKAKGKAKGKSKPMAKASARGAAKPAARSSPKGRPTKVTAVRKARRRA
jgi:DNA transformation protein